MPGGLSSLHPVQRATLLEIGTTDDDVTQGYAVPGHGPTASAGFHDACGTAGGKQYSDCFDLSYDFLDDQKRARLVAGGVCVFRRDQQGGWPGSVHHHCVAVGLRGDDGQCHILPGPRQQIKDFIAYNGQVRNGLSGHAAWQGKWCPTQAERLALQEAYKAWVPDYATAVYLGSRQVYCYAWLIGETVTCEARALIEALGGTVLDSIASGLLVRIWQGATVTLKRTPRWAMSGDFLRGPVRQIAEALGYRCRFEWSDDRSFAKIFLTG